MSPNTDFITGPEFSRWRQDFQAFQQRLDERLERGFSELNDRLDDLNGRTRKNSEAIVAGSGELSVIRDEVDEIRNRGCAQLVNHQQALLGVRTDGTWWTPQRKVAVGVGGAAGGAGIVTLIIELVKSGVIHFGR